MRKNITVPIYGTKVIFFSSLEEFDEFSRSQGGEAIGYGYKGLTGTVNGRLCMVTDAKQAKSPATVAHEATHCAWWVLDDAGVQCTPDNDEALAYLVGWLVERWHKVMV